MAFDADAVIAIVERFCRRRSVAEGTSFTVVPSFTEAVRIALLKGPDNRWKRINARCDAADIPATALEHNPVTADRTVYEFLLRHEHSAKTLGPRTTRAPWFLSYIVVSAAHWARFSDALRQAPAHGLGWLIPAHREVLIVPAPEMRFAEGRPGVLHDDTGRHALEWADRTGYYSLHGTEFGKSLYNNTLTGTLSVDQIALLADADQRSIALSYLTFERLISGADTLLLDTGIKGTALYRLRLPARIARDRPAGYGQHDYFIHMRDASHPEREFIEWVDPNVGEKRNAELCQAHAFGITLEDWLSIEQQG